VIIFGTDPGSSGSISALDDTGVNPVVLGTIKADSSYRDLYDFVVEIMNHGDSAHAYLEKVSASPGAGVSGMFNFGENYGALQMLFTAHHIPFDRVQPLKWQRAMGCARPKTGKGEQKESQTEHKNRTKTRAQELFPEITVTHANADSLLIALYGLRVRTGTLG
jgi:hypothetical protein